ncbi:hypothetical protein [Snodgrassella sp. CFCC 13594]|uniref:hypothetical protein n=1 Tax=Snodgrassella sp. CFCC 13594 TaxID=1775559 RepID=UPI00082AF385|nr:hypothetical protein [Snodgrassella sp. CFCC 13594]
MLNNPYKAIFQQLPAFFIESQRLKFEAAFFNDGLSDPQTRQTEIYAAAFGGWLMALKEQASEQVAARIEARAIRQRMRWAPKTDNHPQSAEEVKQKIIKIIGGRSQ